MPKGKILPSNFNHKVNIQVEKAAIDHLNKMAKEIGSKSEYVNALIMLDRDTQGLAKKKDVAKPMVAAPLKPGEKPATYSPPSGPGTPNYRDPVV